MPELATRAMTLSADAGVISSDMLEPVIDGITANVGVILPVGVAIFAIVIGIKFVPKLFKMFTNA